ncbi:MAG: VIT domain-containing protein [Kofleriaceae bacterium]
MARLAIVCVIAAFASAAHAGDVAKPMGMYVTTPARTALVMLGSTQTVTVRGPIVETVVTQRFENQTDRATEATYMFPLPNDAAISAMVIRQGTRTIRAAIENRADAQRRYEAAVRAGLIAALLEQERSDVFTQTVSAIPAHGIVEVTLRYDAVAQFSAGTWRLVLPMVVAPRMVPGTATGVPTKGTGSAPDTDRAPDASRITPNTSPTAGGKTTVSIHFVDRVQRVTSPTHTLRGTQDVSFVDPRTDHDAIIEWTTSASAAGWSEPGSDGGYAAVLVTAPVAPARQGAIRLMLVLDRSPTIRGDADAVQRSVVRALLASLTAADRVSVIGSERIAWATPGDALAALDAAWQRPPRPFDLTRVLADIRAEAAAVVMVTDGLVADDRAAITTASQLGIPIHVIGVGPAPARGLLTRLAATTRGTIRFAGVGDDLPAIASAAVGDAASPAPAVAVTWGTLAVSDVVPGQLPRLGGGQAMLVLARIKRAELANGRANGELFAIEPAAPQRPLEGATSVVGPLGRRWARARLDELVAAGDRAAIASHALTFGLVSPETSLVAIGSEVIVRDGVKHTVAVPVAVPAGLRWEVIERGAGYTQHSATVDASTAVPPPKAEAEKAAPTSGAAAPSVATAPEQDSAKVGEPVIVMASRDARRSGPILAVGLAGGVAIADGTSNLLVGASLRVDAALDRRLRAGLEGSVWFDESDAHVQVLAIATVLPWSSWWELASGIGAQLGDGHGPAFSIGIRIRPPALPQAAGYLRYDAALLRAPQADAWIFQHVPALGVEWSF